MIFCFFCFALSGSTFFAITELLSQLRRWAQGLWLSSSTTWWSSRGSWGSRGRTLPEHQHEVGHVRAVGHRFREPVDVGDLDLRRGAGCGHLALVGVDPLLDVHRLALEIAQLRALWAHQQEPAEEPDEEDGSDDHTD